MSVRIGKADPTIAHLLHMPTPEERASHFDQRKDQDHEHIAMLPIRRVLVARARRSVRRDCDFEHPQVRMSPGQFLPEENFPQYVFSIGLFVNFGQPEVVIFDPDGKSSGKKDQRYLPPRRKR